MLEPAAITGKMRLPSSRLKCWLVKPEVEHHELEGHRVHDVGDERDRGGLPDAVRRVDGEGGDGVERQIQAEGAADAKPSSDPALQRDHRPHRKREDDEEQRVGLRPGLLQKDRLRGVEGGVHRPPDDDGEAGDLERPRQLGAPDVEELRQEGRNGRRPDEALHARAIIE